MVKSDEGDSFAEYVALKQNQNGEFSITVYKPNLEGNTTCRLEIFFTYTDDSTGQQREVVVYQNNYTFAWNET